MILSAGHLDAVYRLAGADLHYRMEDVLNVLAVAEPRLFSSRGRRNVELLARGTTVRPLGAGLFYAQRPVEEDEQPSFPVRIKSTPSTATSSETSPSSPLAAGATSIRRSPRF